MLAARWWAVFWFWVLGENEGVFGDGTGGTASAGGTGGSGLSGSEEGLEVCLVRDYGSGAVIEWPVCSVSKTSMDTASTEATTTTTATAETATSSNTSTNDAEQDLDTDSPLDNANFLSFEDWKKQNLAKVGQSAENVGGSRRSGAVGKEPRGRPTGINNALDSLGEDTEIELDFGGFGSDTSDTGSGSGGGGGGAFVGPTLSGTAVPSGGIGSSAERVSDGVAGGERQMNVVDGGDDDSPAHGVPRKGASRRKDAGMTCKERFNYASFDCAATVLKTNPECSGSSSVLIENKDSYMLNECRAKNKFLILELCDDILVDTVVLANYEFFSSIFHTFRVSVSDRYPAKLDQWKEIGIYEARNTREVQAFAVENPLIWARYLKIEFVTHYGHEFFCPLSLIRVHGTTMMEEYKHDGEVGRVDEEIDALEAVPVGVDVDVRPESESESQRESPAESAPSPEMWFQRGREIEALLLRGPFGPADTCGIHATAAGFGKLAFESVDASTILGVEEESTASDMSNETTVVQETVNSTIPTPTASASVQNTTETETREDTSPPAPETTTSTTTTTTTQPSPTPNPATQESFFKSVNKRLQILESNSTLSLLYIEEQSRILRAAFNKVERRQLTKTSTFLEHLNETVLAELKQFREQYDLVWKSVVLEFESQRVLHQREMYAVSGQLGVLADELVFQKRVTVVQSLMVLVCFGVILLSSKSFGGIDLQNMVSRSAYATHTHVRSSSSPTFESPVSASPSSTGHSRHRRNGSDDSRGDDADADGRDDNGVPSPTIAYEPPTPTSPSDGGNDGDADHDGGDGDTLAMPAVESHVRSRSSPPVLKGADEDEDGQSLGS